MSKGFSGKNRDFHTPNVVDMRGAKKEWDGGGRGRQHGIITWRHLLSTIKGIWPSIPFSRNATVWRQEKAYKDNQFGIKPYSGHSWGRRL